MDSTLRYLYVFISLLGHIVHSRTMPDSHQTKRPSYSYYFHEWTHKDIPEDTPLDDPDGRKPMRDLWNQNEDGVYGDIVKSDFPKSKGRQRIAVAEEARKWPSNEIPVRIDPGFTLPQLKMIYTAMYRIQRETCVVFREATQNDQSLLLVTRLPGCTSSIGRGAIVKLGGTSASHCFEQTILTHELLHAVGLEHEHSRFDRDHYLMLRRNNVRQELLGNFDIVGPPNYDVYNVTYDYASIMHYGAYAGTRNGGITLEPTYPGYLDVIGRTSVMSEKDRMKVNRMFHCHDPPARTWSPYYEPYWPYDQAT